MSQSITHIRRRNLLLQLNLHGRRALDAGQSTQGAATSFADLIGVHKSLLSKLKGEGSSGRDMSDSMARQIESRLRLPAGWMDEERDDAPPTSAEESLMALALQASRAVTAADRTWLRKLLKSMAETGKRPGVDEEQPAR